MATLPAVCTDTEQAGGGRVDLDLQSPRLLYSQKLRELLSITREGGMVCEISPSLFPCFTFLSLTYSHHIDILHFRHLANFNKIEYFIIPIPAMIMKKKTFFWSNFLACRISTITADRELKWHPIQLTSRPPTKEEASSPDGVHFLIVHPLKQNTYRIMEFSFFSVPPSFLRPIL